MSTVTGDEVATVASGVSTRLRSGNTFFLLRQLDLTTTNTRKKTKDRGEVKELGSPSFDWLVFVSFVSFVVERLPGGRVGCLFRVCLRFSSACT